MIELYGILKNSVPMKDTVFESLHEAYIELRTNQHEFPNHAFALFKYQIKVGEIVTREEISKYYGD